HPHLVGGYSDPWLRIWDGETGQLLRVLRRHTDAINAVVFSPDGTRLASGSSDRTVILSGPDGEITLVGHTGAVNAVAWSPEESLVAPGVTPTSAVPISSPSGMLTPAP